jgi:hypothetical protein
MNSDGLISVSPTHQVRLAQEYHHLILNPPGTDFVVRTIALRKAGDLPLMSAQLVIASADTRRTFPGAETYPLHFRKTYFPASLHGDPQVEYQRQLRASELLPLPAPIGWTPLTFRSCFLPGMPFQRLSAFGIEPEEANIQRAQELSLATVAGLWLLLEQAFSHVSILHRAGFVHGDLELHNMVVCPSPLQVHLIDFENARERGDSSDAQWAALCAKDLRLILREAVYLQCALGEQAGPLAAASVSQLDSLFQHPNRFKRAIHRQAGL